MGGNIQKLAIIVTFCLTSILQDDVVSSEQNIIQGVDSFKFGIATEINKTSENLTDYIALNDVLIVIRSQHYKHHRENAEALKTDLLNQAKALDANEHSLTILMTHESWAPYGAWTILPIISILSKEFMQNKKWVYFCEETTEVDLPKLLKVLSKYSYLKETFLGHALRDTEPAIIHHFAFFEDTSVFAFPDFGAGWAMSVTLIHWMEKRLRNDHPSMDFTIDVQHEVAMYIYHKNKGFRLTNVDEFCTNKMINGSGCASTVNKAKPACGFVPADDIFIGVKTCEKFHRDRMPFVLKTIGKDATHIRYYSDKADKSIPTEYIGVQNTESGHCTKLYNIIKKSHESQAFKDKPWIVIIDDDTIINFSRLQKTLACYDPKEPILLGERYGYGINYETYGYEYITGGGGMILSRAGVKKLMSSDCRCATDDSPDDMWLGMCFRRMGIPTVHNPSFHQARPSQYVPDFLQHQYKVSFHKHYMVDPMDVYRRYLLDNATDEDK